MESGSIGRKLRRFQGRGDLVCASRAGEWGREEMDRKIYDGEREINYSPFWVLRWSTLEEGHG